jgi:hypothetical protein
VGFESRENVTFRLACVMNCEKILISYVFFYRNSPNLLLNELKGFEAPGFMLKKIRAYVSHMRTDRLPESNKSTQDSDLCEATEAGFATVSMMGSSPFIQSIIYIRISGYN